MTRLSSPDPIIFFVAGNPVGKGDHRVVRNKAGVAVGVRDTKGERGTNWRASVAIVARSALCGRALLDEAVRVTLRIFRVHPKGHYMSGKNAGKLKPGVPRFPTSSPDIDKIARSVGDALNGVVWRDDAQITTWSIKRRWGEEVGVLVSICPESEED